MAGTARTAVAPRSRYSLPTYESPRPPPPFLCVRFAVIRLWSRWPIGAPHRAEPRKE
nr:MAG TPA: hypothetical protein [Caudoviricetes sp.]